MSNVKIDVMVTVGAFYIRMYFLVLQCLYLHLDILIFRTFA